MSLGLPDLQDGLTPEGRRVLLATAKASRACDPDVVNTFKALSTAWEADASQSSDELFAQLLRLSQPWLCRYPLIRGRGNFGSVDGATAAPAQYTRVDLTPLGCAVVGATEARSIENPGCFPSSFPHLLCNGALAHTGVIDLDGQGADDPGPEPPDSYYRVPTGRMIGGTLEAFFPPHHLGRVCEALDFLLDHPGAGPGELLPILRGPDFPTGGRLLNPGDLRRIYAEGEGVLRVAARASLARESGTEVLLLRELPFGTTTGELVPWLIHAGALDVRVGRAPEDPIGFQVQVRIQARSREVLEDMLSDVLKRELKVRMSVIHEGRTRTVSLVELLKGHLETIRKLLQVRSGDALAVRGELSRWRSQADTPRTELP